MPPQDCHNDYILDYIGRHSLKESDGGWTWKFDDEMFNSDEFKDEMDELRKELERLKLELQELREDKD